MRFLSNRWSRFFQGINSTAGPSRRYGPTVEMLEERSLLSAGFGQVNLASDVPGLAQSTDPNLVNPWGISFSSTGPFWFSDNGTGVSDLLNGSGKVVPLVVTIPANDQSTGQPTGTVFNNGSGFAVGENGVSAPGQFLFATEDGTIAAWAPAVDPVRALVAVDNSSAGAVYKGLALATDPAGHSLLYAADFKNGKIDVFDENFQPVGSFGGFQDPNLPKGFAPFNIQTIDNLLYVTYARQDEDGGDEYHGAGLGFIDIYNHDGSLVQRFASQGALNAPWGMAKAPADFGPYGGALLVGNTGDGHINAYDPTSGAYLGQLRDDNGTPLAIPELWALTFGNGHMGGDSHTLFFASGLDDEQHGLFGAIQAPQQRDMDTAGNGIFDPKAPGERDDYPLPPSGGPSLRVHSEDVRPLTAVLLPFAESSPALVPTLTAVDQPSPRIDPPVRVPPAVLVSLGEVATPGQPGSSPNMPLPSLPVSQSPPASQNAAVALNTFLDWQPSSLIFQARMPVEGAVGGQQQSMTQDGVSGQHETAGVESAGLDSERGVALGEDRSAASLIGSFQNHGGWTTFAKSLFSIASIAALWAWAGRPALANRPRGKETFQLDTTRVI